MGIGIISNDERDSFVKFLQRRQAKATMIELLKEVKEENNLKLGQVTTAENATYELIVDSIDTAMKEEWLSDEKLQAYLDRVEVAGRQHVFVFQTMKTKGNEIRSILSNPKHLRDGQAELEEFWDPPADPFARVVTNEAKVVIAKLVTTRVYATENLEEKKATYEMWKKTFHQERSASIVKYDGNAHLLQVRIPPREHGSLETARRAFDFMEERLSLHFDYESLSAMLGDIRISNAYNAILKNRTDFRLESDSPENDQTKSNITRKNASAGNGDLRDAEGWDHEEGYSRQSLRGFWKFGESEIFAHVNSDRLTINAKTSRSVARLFIPDRRSDQEIDHVIARLLDHIQPST